MTLPSESCDLCGLTLRCGHLTLQASDRGYRFCCAGCKQVFNILLEATGAADPGQFRQTDLFKRCRRLGIIPATEEELGRLSASAKPAPQTDELTAVAVADGAIPGNERHGPEFLPLQLGIDGMWCPACAWLIETSLGRLAGVRKAACNFSTDRLRCEYDPIRTSPDQIIDFIEKFGYRAARPGEGDRAGEQRREFIRFGVSAFLTMNVMMMSFALYSGFFNSLAPDAVSSLSWPIFLLATIVLAYGGTNIFRKALAGFTTAAFSMETLIALGAASAYTYSVYNLARGNIHLYFDTAAMLITLVLLGKLLERNGKARVLADLETFFSLLPTKVKICTSGFPEGRYVAAEHLRENDLFKLEEDEISPADGLVEFGQGLVDESSLSGEARPVQKIPGDRVRSGTRVSRGVFKVRALAVGEESTLGQMMRIIDRSLTRKTDFEGKTDRLLRGFVPLIIFLAVATGFWGFVRGLPPGDALIRAVTVLVISCPCALGVAIPLTRVAGISMAGRKGVLVRDFAAFEQAQKVDTFVFDKTGTLTEGHWRLLSVVSFSQLSADRIVELAASLERDSVHPVAIELKQRARLRAVEPAVVTGIRQHANGISGCFDNKEIKIGSAGFLKAEIAASPPLSDEDVRSVDAQASRIYMSLDGRLCAVLVFGDRLRSGALKTIEHLRARGYALAVVSGDATVVTRSLSRALGIDHYEGDLLPEDKAAFLERLRKRGRQVAMVGDGVNDAQAMAGADLAIAVHSGSHLGKEVADITLMRGDPQQILDFLMLVEKTNRKILQNLWFSFLYNFISIPLAMSGLLTPLVAVSAMLLSSLSVIGNTLLLVRFASAASQDPPAAA